MSRIEVTGNWIAAVINALYDTGLFFNPNNEMETLSINGGGEELRISRIHRDEEEDYRHGLRVVSLGETYEFSFVVERFSTKTFPDTKGKNVAKEYEGKLLTITPRLSNAIATLRNEINLRMELKK